MNEIPKSSAFAPHPERGTRWHIEEDIFDKIGKPGRKELKHIPGKKGLPYFGILPEAVLDPLKFAERLHAKHGRVYCFYALGSWNVQLVGPEANELVLFDKDSTFSAHGGWGPVIEPFFPGALLIQDGERHRANRRILGEAFKQQKLTGYQQIFDRDIERSISSWCGRTFDVYDEVKRLTLRIAASTFLGIDMDEKADKALRSFSDMMGALLAINQNKWLSPVAARGFRGKAFLETYVRELIAERRANPGDDMLSRVCQVGAEDGEGLTEEEIYNSTIFLLAAAHDTLASAFTSSIYFLAKHRDWAELLREEVKRAKLSNPIDAGTASLPLHDMFFKEAMRLNPPAPIVWRRAVRDFSIYGYDIPAGTITGINPLLVHRDPEIWEDPLRFNPFRFTPEEEAKRHKHAFVPFGSGVHKCLGLHFAQQQARIFLSRLVSTADVQIHADGVQWYHWPNCRPRRRVHASATARPRKT
ncbi:MAG TPA: cytochrome P450 [Allosphingosinicella sp.]